MPMLIKDSIKTLKTLCLKTMLLCRWNKP